MHMYFSVKLGTMRMHIHFLVKLDAYAYVFSGEIGPYYAYVFRAPDNVRF